MVFPPLPPPPLPDTAQGTTSSAVTQQFTYMLVKTGTVVLKAETDMKGYTPGQVIQVTANIHNQSGKSTGHMAASLMQVQYSTRCLQLRSCFALTDRNRLNNFFQIFVVHLISHCRLFEANTILLYQCVMFSD